TFKGRGLRVSDRMLDRAFAVRIAYPGRIGHHTVMTQHHGVHGIEFGLVQVGRKHPFLQVIEHDVVRRAAKVTPGLLMQLRPGFLAGLPDDTPETAPRVAQRHHKQAWTPISLCTWHAGGSTFAIVDLRLFARSELQPVELLGVMFLQFAREAFYAVVGPCKAKLIDQVLVDRRAVASYTK